MEEKEKQDDYLLEVDNLKMYFDITTGFFKTSPLKAVDGVSFKIKRGETLGVVGESGCGKTTLGRTIMNLYNPSSGDILFDGVSISPYSDLKKIKKEKEFAKKCLHFDMHKEIAELKKSGNQTPEKIEAIKVSYNDRILASNKAYDEKYEAKRVEIRTSLENIDLDCQKKLAELKAVEKGTVETTSVDAKVLEYKLFAKQEIDKLKETYHQEMAAARIQNSLAKLATNDEFKQKKQDLSSLDKDEYKKAYKAYKIDYIVAKEKNQNDYSVLKSKAFGKYQSGVDAIKTDLDTKISNERATNEYYKYVDEINQIIMDARLAKYNIKTSSKQRMKKFRKECTMVFQDPYSSLNPRMTVADIIAEPLDVNKLYKTKEERRSIVLDLMKKVGLSPEQSTRYAHEFSGGQRQRIGIARALAVNPKFIVCDEPVSALDVSIQAQVINTFEDLQKDLGLTYLFIAHDLLVIRHISDRIAVMYLGRVVELAETNELYDNPLHPYTISLLSAIPMPDPDRARNNKRIILQGDVPSPLNVPSGCPFRTRCARACEKCKNESPKLTEVKPGHFVSCLLVQEEQK